MSKRVNISVDLNALQAVIGEWPGVEEVATQLGRPPHHVHTMLNDGRLKGIRTRVGWIIHPACVERVARGTPSFREHHLAEARFFREDYPSRQLGE
jgi:hypothetical protein